MVDAEVALAQKGEAVVMIVFAEDISESDRAVGEMMRRWPPWTIALRNQLAVVRNAVEVRFQDLPVVVMVESHDSEKMLLKDRYSILDTSEGVGLELLSNRSMPMSSQYTERGYIHLEEGAECRHDDSDVVLKSSVFCQPSNFSTKIEPGKGLSTTRMGTRIGSFPRVNTSKRFQWNSESEEYLCRASELLSLKDFMHSLHVWGLSPVCTRV
jgi:hypothetical protein